MDEEEELRGLFEIETRERLARMQQGLLRLEEQPQHAPSIVDGLFREAHSLKGAARLLSLDALESVTHRLEDLLGHLKRGRLTVTAEVVDKLFAGMEAAAQLCQEAIERSPGSRVDLAAVLLALDDDSEQKPPTVTTPAVRAEPLPSGAVATEPTLQLETLRVQAASLDELMTMIGELRATYLENARRIDDADLLLGLWEEASRAARRGEPAGTVLERLGSQLVTLRGSVYSDHARLEGVTRELDEKVRQIRLVPLETLFGLCPPLVRNLSRTLGKSVRLEMEGGHQLADKRIVQELKDPLLHLLRNSVHHGAVPGREMVLEVRAGAQGDRFWLEVTDDGRGLDRTAILRRLHEMGLEEDVGDQAIFLPGFSTARKVDEVSGRGVGLDVVKTAVEAMRGTVRVDSEPGRGCRFWLEIPRALSTTAIVLVRVGASLFGIDSEAVQSTLSLHRDQLETVGGKLSLRLEKELVSVAALGDLLGLVTSLQEVLLGVQLRHEPQVLLVDQVVGVDEVVPRPAGSWQARAPHLAGVALLGNGEVVLLIDPVQLLRHPVGPVPRGLPEPVARVRRILLVEDSLTTRAQEKRILEGAGYEVTIAVDGLDGWQKLATGRFDAVVSDIEMPNLDGLSLTRRIRENPRYRELPVVLVSSLSSEEDRRRGFEVGADAYLPKPGLDASELLQALERLT